MAIIKTIKKNDFSSMTYNVMRKDLSKFDGACALFPNLCSIRGAHRDKVIKYLFLIYDKGSPLLSISSIKDKIDTALYYSGLHERSEKLINEVVHLTNPLYLAGAQEILRQHNSIKLRHLLVLNQAFLDIERQALLPIYDIKDDKQRYDACHSKMRVLKELSDIVMEIERIMSELYDYETVDGVLNKVVSYDPAGVASLLDTISDSDPVGGDDDGNSELLAFDDIDEEGGFDMDSDSDDADSDVDEEIIDDEDNFII